jgi:hypothetical protein
MRVAAALRFCLAAVSAVEIGTPMAPKQKSCLQLPRAAARAEHDVATVTAEGPVCVGHRSGSAPHGPVASCGFGQPTWHSTDTNIALPGGSFSHEQPAALGHVLDASVPSSTLAALITIGAISSAPNRF